MAAICREHVPQDDLVGPCRKGHAEVVTVDPTRPGPLHVAIASLAEMPDDASGMDDILQLIAGLTATLLPSVDYASITALRHGAASTVAMSSDLALAVDEAQYADGTGPCLEALNGEPIEVPCVATLVNWPGFKHAALGFGLQASLSIPLVAGRGIPIAALNLYTHHAEALKPLGSAISAVIHSMIQHSAPASNSLDHGSWQLVAGLAEALAIQRQIQIAVGILMARRQLDADAAYLQIREEAAATGRSLRDTASAFTADTS
jgi:hypothetical protein